MGNSREFNDRKNDTKEKIMKKIIGIVLVLIIVLSCLNSCADNKFHLHIFKQKIDGTRHFKECSCGEIKDSSEHDFSLRKDYMGRECAVCGYITNEINPGSIERNDDGTIKIREGLISGLNEYFRCFNVQGMTGQVSFEEKLNKCKNEYNPLLVKFGSECYYVAAYYDIPEGHNEWYCCYDEYTWVAFEKAEDVKECFEDKAIVGAFQINLQEFCVNIETDTSDVTMEHFSFYNPEFVDSVAIAPEITFDDLFVYITPSSEKYICYSSSNRTHKLQSFNCVEFQEKYYIRVNDSDEYNKNNFGEYYDELVSIQISIDVTPSAEYMFFKLEDIAKIIK